MRFVLVLLLLPALALACPRPTAFPKELPLTPCPLSALDVGCDRCLPNQTHVTVFYMGDPAEISNGLSKALEKDGWKVTLIAHAVSEEPGPGVTLLTIIATKGKSSLTAEIQRAKHRGHTRMPLVFTRG